MGYATAHGRYWAVKVSATLFRPSRQLAATPTGAPNDPPAGAVGTDGDSWYAEILGGGPDVNPELTGSAKFDVFDEMSKTDAAVKSLLLVWILSVRGATWGLNPRSDDPIDKVICDAACWNFGLEDQDGQMDMSWKESLNQCVSSILKMGPCIEELVWGDLRQWRDADGDPHLVRPLEQLAYRHPRTIQRFEMEKGRPKKVTQNLPDSNPMPGEKLSYMVFERNPGHWDGVSMLRAAWGPWRIKKALLIATGIGWDRWSSGIPAVFHPNNQEAEARAKQIAREIRHHERAYVTFPVSEGATSYKDSDWWLEIINGASSIADPTPFVNLLTAEIADAGLTAWSKLGRTETGSRAVGQVQIEPFYLGVSELADYVRRERSRQAIRKFVEVNFGAEAAEKRMPILTVSKIQSRNLETIARAIYYLGNAGFTFTDREAKDDMRELLGFGPELASDLAAQGVDRAQLETILKGMGLDPATLAQIVNALPADLGVAVSKVGVTPGTKPPAAEGTGLRVANEDRTLVAITRSLEDVRQSVAALADRPAPPAPAAQPIEVNVTTPDVRFEEGAIRVEAPPAANVEVNVAGQQRTGTSTIEKKNGKTIVHHNPEA